MSNIVPIRIANSETLVLEWIQEKVEAPPEAAPLLARYRTERLKYEQASERCAELKKQLDAASVDAMKAEATTNMLAAMLVEHASAHIVEQSDAAEEAEKEEAAQ